ncbi:FIST signal transduction protein [Lutibacter citreus]|uniref:FIST signal transduction protein n=1 Tax=Lutibacter citreus TaxID=2138210 RepID=UPI000DBE08E2|nr:FIST N-terminal domain-containing protein [Lutibacter citreus]
MKVVQAKKVNNKKWEYVSENIQLSNPLVLVFGSRFLLEKSEVIDDLRVQFPYEHIVFGSTAGEILGESVYEDSIVVTAIEFEKSNFEVRTASVFDYDKDAKLLGESLIKQMPSKNLKHLFTLSEGSFVNGSALIEGIESSINNISLTGGMCGDGILFNKTLASYKTNPKEGEVVLIGFYGDTLEFSFASIGGWNNFGPERIITKSEGNILYEIDNLPALDLYSKYLGDKASELPQASLFYPLNVTHPGKKKPVVRTILSINKEDNSMVLAGDAPENSKVQLMMSSVDDIVSGAYEAAELAMKNRKNKPELALLVSCVGRKLVMDQRVEEEIEEVMSIVGDQTNIIGFYSYGEMAPFYGQKQCELHNQTMTLTLISE